MQYAVCAHYDDTTILIDIFDSKEQANKFSDTPVYINDEDMIYPDEMWVEPYEDIPFCEPVRIKDLESLFDYSDELPF